MSIEQLYEVAVERPGTSRPVIYQPVPAHIALRNARMLQHQGFKCHILVRAPNRLIEMSVNELEKITNETY